MSSGYRASNVPGAIIASGTAAGANASCSRYVAQRRETVERLGETRPERAHRRFISSTESVAGRASCRCAGSAIHARLHRWHFRSRRPVLGLANDRLVTADSTGRCNSSMESFSRCFVVQRLPWALVQPSCHGVEFGLRVDRQVDAFREVLTLLCQGTGVESARSARMSGYSSRTI
jgi:hypothetical protein